MTAAALCVGVVIGSAMAIDPRIGLALLCAACLVPLALVDVALGIGVWAALISLSNLPRVGLAATGAGVLVVSSWMGVAARGSGRLQGRIAAPGGVVAFALLLAWLSLSLTWAEKPGNAAGELGRWYLGALVFVVVATAVRRRRDARVVVTGFVLGAVASVVLGLVHDGLGGRGATVSTLTSVQGRLKGGLGDPNVLAAVVVPAVVLAVALMPSARRWIRWVLLACAGLLVVGLGATQSRGGVVATMTAFGAGLLLMKRQRARVLTAGAAVALVGMLYLSAYPDARARLTTSDAGNGRTDIWRVAWRITADHPVVGVGLHNFTVYSPRYVRRPGELNFVDLIAERPHAVHNTYLELLAETGVVGLGLFLAVVSASLAAAWRAAIRFEQLGDYAFATLSRGVLVATLAFLAAAFFVTMGSRSLLWFLLALGPALLAVGRACAAPPA